MRRSREQRAPEDTIAAVATAPGRGGVGIVRISGTALQSFVRALTGREAKPRHAGFVRFLDRDGQPIDEGLLLYFPAPGSFTGEDVVELQGHGGPVVMQMLLSRCLELGARLAQPGEFSRRAFLNGRMDLAQAEAVADLIEARTAAAARSALRSLSGEFSRKVDALQQELIDLRMLVEATLDFPEEEVEVLEGERAAQRIAVVRSRLERILDGASQGAILRNGLNVVLVGEPNVGKSSLLNALAGEERAIVTEIAGTTRDALRETIGIEGIPVHIIDTAGLRDTSDPVERIGVERAWHEISRAHVALRLIDARAGKTEGDAEIDRGLPSGVEVITVFNKIDLCGRTPVRRDGECGVELMVSAKTGAGMSLLRDELLRVVGWHGGDEDVVLARERHLVALRSALAHVGGAGSQGMRLELVAEELRLAQLALGEITGEFTADDLLGVIFCRFCIGK
ncbi:MAG TPA: tRNA uridine-5-carboxymethylaminomethyl(34) synthesis GTPase MnmE [Rhodocyclaceae bacterium]|nr:tRNA uridine-5-carboxymethylaminomethyl(34) synthesis GTPase MnmE [Rhodocyclaceae bacterium]HRQ46095.1 tRNA uridine-5-carboxymethylaminomethyl(34) synthesis GTPase MnmE [Rhodocyclaceae bacterium]